MLQTAKSAFTVTAAHTASSGVLGGVLTTKTVSIVAAVGIAISAAWLFGQPDPHTPGDGPIVLAEATPEEIANSDLGPEATPQQIVAAFQDTLARQLPSVFSFSTTVHVSQRASSPENIRPGLEGDRIYYKEGALATDGKLLAMRIYTWGKPGSTLYPKDDPQYEQIVYDGNEFWSYYRAPHFLTCVTQTGD